MHIPIEIASLKSWPAFKQEMNNGWVSRYAEGFTKRANSVTVLYPNKDLLEPQVARCESSYNRVGLPCIFRLLSFNDNKDIEAILGARGYTGGDHSLVLSQNIEKQKFQPVELDLIPVDKWLKHYCQMSGTVREIHATHIRMINSIAGAYTLAILPKNGHIMSCGLGVVSNGYFGLFDIVTHPEYRNKGYGAELITGLLSWATQNMAHTAYVQVVAENKPAVRLYQKLGYELSYEYHYIIQDISRQPP